MQKPVVALILSLSFTPLFAQSPPCLSLYLEAETAAPGEEVCLDVTAGAYDGLLGLLFEVRWDTSVLAFKRVGGLQLPYLYEYNFNLLPAAVGNGYTVVNWYDPSIAGVSLAEGAPLFSLCFEVVGEAGAFGQVHFAGRNGLVELVDADLNAVDSYSLAQGGVYVSEQPVDAPVISQACAQASNCRGDNAIHIVVDGGFPPYTYEWRQQDTLLATTPILLGQPAGEYSVIVTDSAGRQAAARFSAIPELFPLVEDSYVSSTSCVGGADGRIGLLIGNGSGQYAYAWNNGANGPELDSLPAGSYAVTVTDLATACTLEWQAELYDGRPKPVAIEVEAAACNADIGAIRLQLNGSNTFLWSTGATEEDIDSLSAGSYTVTITHELGCFARTIDVPLLDGPYFTAAVTQPQCGGANGAVEIHAPGDSLLFQWNTGAEGPLLSGLPAGNYELLLSDGNGCEAAAAFELVSESLLAVPDISCRPGSSGSYASLLYTVWDGGQPPYTFSWSTGLTEVSSLSSTLDSVPDGTYTISITDAAGCTYIVDTLVANCSGPQLEVALSSSCHSYADTAFTLLEAVVSGGGAAPYTFEWSTGVVEVHESASQIVVSTNGFISVKVRDASGSAFEELWAQPSCIRREEARLSISDALVYNGAKAQLNVRLGALHGLDSLKLPLYWDGSRLRLDSITGLRLPGLVPDDFEQETPFTGNPNIQLLTLRWANAGGQPLNLEEGASLFQLHFSVNSSPGELLYVRWGQDGLGGAPRIFPANGADVPLTLDDGRIQVRYYSNAPPLILSIEEKTAATASPACLAVRADNFTDIITAQFSMIWDPDTLSFQSVQAGSLPGLDESYFGMEGIGGGELYFSWNTIAQQGLSVPAGATLFSVCFETAPTPGYSPLRIASGRVPIQASAYTGVLAYATQDGGLLVKKPDVWPGDTDGNGLAGHYDLLHIGLAFNATGPTRQDTASAWQAYIAEDWWQRLPRSGLNFKHIDANGNGRIEASDTLAITRNWGAATADFDPAAPLFDSPPGLVLPTPLYVGAAPITEGQAAVFDVILGEAALPANRVYGLAFTIRYDTAVALPGSASLSFGDSWLGGGLLSLFRNQNGGDRVDVAITRTGLSNASGFGPIARLHLDIREQPQAHALRFQIENVRLLDKDERLYYVRTPPTAAPVGSLVNSAGEPAGAGSLRLFPNPARGQVFILAPGMRIERAEACDARGNKVRDWGAGPAYGLEGLPAGQYYVKIFTEQGVVVRPLIVNL